jgi:ParB family chromosome partitioning protein
MRIGGLFVFLDKNENTGRIRKAVRKSEEKKEMCSSWQEDYDTVSEMVKSEQEIVKIKLNKLSDFKNHPFKVEYNAELFELMKSIDSDGVLVPLLVRPKPKGQGYEIIAGHRRRAACAWAGIGEVPVIVRNLSDRQAIIAMVNSNLQRENIKPSEKAYAYRMRLEAMKQQGKRTDLTSSQVGTKLEEANPTVKLSKVESTVDADGIWGLESKPMNEGNVEGRSDALLSKQLGESRNQIARYIRLTYLIPKLLDMVDAEKIAFTVAVELSYLKEEEQYELHAVMDLEQCTPSLSQANRLKRLSQGGKLDMEEIYQVMEEEKPNQKPQLKIKAEREERLEDVNQEKDVQAVSNTMKQAANEYGGDVFEASMAGNAIDLQQKASLPVNLKHESR